MHAVTCEICGRNFAAAYPNSKYCSYECRNLADRLRRRNWNIKNPDYNRNYYQARKAAQAAE